MVTAMFDIADDPLDWDGSEGEAKSLSEFREIGPVAAAFMAGTGFIEGIMGPYGAGKTTTCFQRIIRSALLQRPAPDGVRRVRWCVLRDTYSQLESNVMADWFSWFPKTKENYNGERKESKHLLDFPGFGLVEINILWRALGEDNKPEMVFKGMQLTGLWLNETDTLYESCLKFGLPRVGRYPLAKDGGCAFSCIIMDFNAPEVTNWTYELFVDGKLPLSEPEMQAIEQDLGQSIRPKLYRQPSGRSPEAENLHNLPHGYYARMAMGMSENEQRRFIDNEFGAVRAGQPVFPEFNDRFHVSEHNLVANADWPLFLAVDGGSTPAAVIGQKSPDGQVRLIDEIVVLSPDKDTELAKMGGNAFGVVVKDHLNEHYPDCQVGDVWADPATEYGDYSAEHEEDQCWLDDFADTLALRCRAAPVPGNRLNPRLKGVRDLLTNNVGAKPGLLVSPKCKKVRQGFNNGYVIAKRKLSNGKTKLKDEPEKNDFSHVHDALQYLVAGLTKANNVLLDLEERRAQRQRGKGVKYGGAMKARRK